VYTYDGIGSHERVGYSCQVSAGVTALYTRELRAASDYSYEQRLPQVVKRAALLKACICSCLCRAQAATSSSRCWTTSSQLPASWCAPSSPTVLWLLADMHAPVLYDRNAREMLLLASAAL
jgi:hypothetical protein